MPSLIRVVSAIALLSLFASCKPKKPPVPKPPATAEQVAYDEATYEHEDELDEEASDADDEDDSETLDDAP